jgi:hypothetical protein
VFRLLKRNGSICSETSESGIARKAYEVRKQLQDLRIDVALVSETNLKPHTRIYIPNYNIYRTHRQDEHKGVTAAAVKKQASLTNTCWRSFQ